MLGSMKRPLKKGIRIALLAGGGAVLLLAAALPIWAEDQPAESVAMLARARKLEELRSDSNAPFLMEAQIKATFGDRKVTGEYKLGWWTPNHWHEVLALGDFRRIRDGVSDGYWQVRTWEYQPRVIFDLDQVLDVAPILQVRSLETAKGVRRRKVASIALSCVEIHLKHGVARELCFDPATELLLHAQLEPGLMPGSEPLIVDYSGAIALSDKKFPSTVIIQRGKRISVEVSITRLEPASGNPDPPFVTDPGHSEFWRACRDIARPEGGSQVLPHFPEDSRAKREQGIVSFYARIETDGSISHLKTLQSPSPSLEHSAREAVEQWKYKPRTCGGTPVKEETIIDVSFWLQ